MTLVVSLDAVDIQAAAYLYKRSWIVKRHYGNKETILGLYQHFPFTSTMRELIKMFKCYLNVNSHVQPCDAFALYRDVFTQQMLFQLDIHTL